MPRETLKYTNEDVTVVWKPKLCIHSAICFKGLPEVFDPKARPWVNMAGADAQRIIEQVHRCPSGALSIDKQEEPTPLNTTAGTDEPTLLNTGAGNEESVTQPVTLQLKKNGPILVRGTVVLQFPDGHEEVKEGNIALCRCGVSGNKPYCDGSHNKMEFEG